MATAPDGGSGPQARHLKHLAATSTHVVCDNPDEADLVLMTDMRGGQPFSSTARFFAAVRRYRCKLFVHNEAPRPIRLWPGAYTSMPRSRIVPGFATAIAYPCWTGCLNRYVVSRSTAPPQSRRPDLLYSFLGRDCGNPRQQLFRLDHPNDTVVRDTSTIYDHWNSASATYDRMQREYVDTALRSKFSLCPKGWAESSIRLYEMMALGVAPVIIADRWVPPVGPDWPSFAVFVAERDIALIPDMLTALGSEWKARGQTARAAWDRYFAPKRQFDSLIHALTVLRPDAEAGRNLAAAMWPVTVPATMIDKLVHGH